jgi:MFS family permease
LGGNVILWGIATACTGAATDYRRLLTARIFLGIFEAAIAPSLMLISSQWYTKSEQAPRFSLWYCGLGLGQILGGIVSYAFQKIHHPIFAGWKIMFIILGIVTVLIGITTIVFLPDTPMKARFLLDAEKAAILNHVSENQTGILNTHFTPSHLIEILLDPQLWLLTVLTILVCGNNHNLIPKSDNGADFHFQWRDNHLQRHLDPKLWILSSRFGTSQHAFRYHINLEHSDRWLGNSPYV